MILKNNSYIILILILFTFSCKKELTPVDGRSFTTNPRPDCENCSILFIGSSYLSYVGNDVVDIFNAFTDKTNKSIYIDQVIIGGQRLHDHIENPLTLSKIREWPWSYIIFQGNSAYISQEKWHQYLIPYLIDFKKIIRENNKNAQMIRDISPNENRYLPIHQTN